MTLTKTNGFYFPPVSPPEEKRGKCFDLRSLHYFLKRSESTQRHRIVVQAGGLIGVWPTELSKHYDTVFTFEPDHESFNCLNLNCHQKNIIKLQAALGNTRGLVRVEGKLIGSHRTYPVDKSWFRYLNEGLIVPQIRIDDLNLPYCDAIILDVEGYEFRALKGAFHTIVENQPLILIEERKKVKIADKNEPLPGKYLEQLGYQRIHHLAGDGIYNVDK